MDSKQVEINPGKIFAVAHKTRWAKTSRKVLFDNASESSESSDEEMSKKYKTNKSSDESQTLGSSDTWSSDSSELQDEDFKTSLSQTTAAKVNDPLAPAESGRKLKNKKSTKQNTRKKHPLSPNADKENCKNRSNTSSDLPLLHLSSKKEDTINNKDKAEKQRDNKRKREDSTTSCSSERYPKRFKYGSRTSGHL